MIEPLTLRNHIFTKLELHLGTYTFADGSKQSAIAVLPDPQFGYNYPQEGTKIEGCECVVVKQPPEVKQLFNAVQSDEYWLVHLKQWDNNGSLVDISKELIKSLVGEYWICKSVYIPESNKLLTIEQYKVYLKEALVYVKSFT